MLSLSSILLLYGMLVVLFLDLTRYVILVALWLLLFGPKRNIQTYSKPLFYKLHIEEYTRCHCSSSELTSIDLCQCMCTEFTPNFMMNTSIYYNDTMRVCIYCLMYIYTCVYSQFQVRLSNIWVCSVFSSEQCLFKSKE